MHCVYTIADKGLGKRGGRAPTLYRFKDMHDMCFVSFIRIVRHVVCVTVGELYVYVDGCLCVYVCFHMDIGFCCVRVFWIVRPLGNDLARMDRGNHQVCLPACLAPCKNNDICIPWPNICPKAELFLSAKEPGLFN